MSIPTD